MSKNTSSSNRLGKGYIFFISLVIAVVLGFFIFAILISTNTISCADPAVAPIASGDAYYDDVTGNTYVYRPDIGFYYYQDPNTGGEYLIDTYSYGRYYQDPITLKSYFIDDNGQYILMPDVTPTDAAVTQTDAQ